MNRVHSIQIRRNSPLLNLCVKFAWCHHSPETPKAGMRLSNVPKNRVYVNTCRVGAPWRSTCPALCIITNSSRWGLDDANKAERNWVRAASTAVLSMLLHVNRFGSCSQCVALLTSNALHTHKHGFTNNVTMASSTSEDALHSPLDGPSTFEHLAVVAHRNWLELDWIIILVVSFWENSICTYESSSNLFYATEFCSFLYISLNLVWIPSIPFSLVDR